METTRNKKESDSHGQGLSYVSPSEILRIIFCLPQSAVCPWALHYSDSQGKFVSLVKGTRFKRLVKKLDPYGRRAQQRSLTALDQQGSPYLLSNSDGKFSIPRGLELRQ